ncbi:unnamed protein product, partial [marine sediment metagenome]
NEFKKIPQNREFNSQEIFHLIVDAASLNDTMEVKNLIYLGILKTIFKKCQFGGHYDFSEYGENKLRTFLQEANIDKEITIFTLSGDDSPFKMLFKCHNFKDLPNGFDTFYKNLFFPIEDRWYAVFYSHFFNTNSCYICNNIVVRKDMAKTLFSEINKLPLEKILEKSYSEIKREYMGANEENLPLFEYRDKLLIFLNRYIEKLERCLNTPFFEQILNSSEKISLEDLKNKGLVEIKNRRIIAIAWQVEHLKVLHHDLKKREDERIGANITELFFAWIRSEESLKFEPKQTEPFKPRKNLKKLN